MSFWARRRAIVNLIGILMIAGLWLLLGFGGLTLARSLGIDSFWNPPILYALLLISILVVLKFYDRMPAVWAGIGVHPWMPRELGTGLLLGATMAVVAWSPTAIIGGAAWVGAFNLAVHGLYIPLTASGEELLFRGYLYQRFIEIMGPTAATLAVSAVFAVAHLANPEFTAVSALNIFLAGLFFSLGYLRTGSIWLPLAAHIAWNLTLALLGTRVSGVDFGPGLLAVSGPGPASGSAVGPALITGGAFGPEGGLASTAALLAGIVALLRLPAITLSPWVHARVFRAVHRRAAEGHTP